MKKAKDTLLDLLLAVAASFLCACIDLFGHEDDDNDENFE